MLSAVAVLWGAGFVLNSQLMKATFSSTPALLNALRFAVSALCLLVIFNKRIKANGRVLLYGAVGGALLFGGFMLQLVGINYTTPSHNGFFTAMYMVIVPFLSWIVYRRRPHWIVFVGVALAVGGLLMLNFATPDESGATVKGDLISLACALFFAAQIVWTDFLLKNNKTDYVQLTFWQVTFAAILFVLYTFIFESKHYASLQFDAGFGVWRLVIVVLGGTAFAYYAQTYAQTRLTPSETSLILAWESPLGAILSVIVGAEPFLWQTLVGGLMVIAAVVPVELVPTLCAKRKRSAPQTLPSEPPTSDESEQNAAETPTSEPETTDKPSQNSSESPLSPDEPLDREQKTEK